MLVCKNDNIVNAPGSSGVKLRIPPKGTPSFSHSQTHCLLADTQAFRFPYCSNTMYMDRDLLFVIVDRGACRCLFLPNGNHMC